VCLAQEELSLTLSKLEATETELLTVRTGVVRARSMAAVDP
jgi:hypothetical protein